MASGIAAAGLVLLVVGVLAVTAGLGLLVFTQDDPAAQATDPAVGAGASGEDERQGRMGQTISVGGGAVAFLGLVFIVIGRAD